MTSPLTPVQRIAHHAKLAVYRAGFEVRRETFKRHFVHSLHAHGIDTVLDIGANTGQFAEELRRGGFTGRIVSVEPLGAAFAQLRAKAQDDAGWTARQAAVGAEPGTLIMNVAGNSTSSSVLPMMARHTEAAPHTAYVATEQVEAVTVDALTTESGLTPASTLLKIDVQGYEGAVLDGAEATLATVAAVRTEMSLVALYEGQALFGELLTRLERLGFELWSIEPGFVEPGTGRLLQADGIFYRTPSEERP